MKKNKTAWPFIFVSLLIVIVDQLVKYYFLTHYNIHTIVRIFPCLNFILSFNSGSAFGFLSNQPGWQIYLLSAVSIIVSGILVGWLCRLSRQEWWIALPVSFVLGGAIGNLIDRMRFGFVIDFIDFHVGNWHYATFNVADSFVCVGAIWIILRLVYESITSKS